MIKTLKQIKSVRHILPVLMVLLTGKGRYSPTLDFNWKHNVTHSLLMCYYWLFGRRWGIRPGGLTYYQDSKGKRKVWVTTWFGALQFLEHEIIRPAFRWKWQPFEIYIPTFNGVNSSLASGSPFLFAIAFEEAEGVNSGTSTSPSLANVEGSGSDRWLAVHLNFGAASVSAVPAFGGSNTTIINVNQNTSDGTPNLSTYRLIAPSTSSGSITATLSGSVFWLMMATTYTGVDQTTSTADEDGSQGALGTPLTVQNTSDLNGSWQFVSAKEDSAATSFTLDSPAQLRQGEDGAPTNILGDGATEINSASNGSITLNWTGGGQRIGYQTCMIRPVATATSTSDFFQMF